MKSEKTVDILRKRLLDNLILELIAFHSYEDVKLVFMIDNDDYDYYKKFKILPFVWDNLREMRFFAENYDEASKISFYLEQVFSHRKYSDADKITISDDFQRVILHTRMLVHIM